MGPGAAAGSRDKERMKIRLATLHEGRNPIELEGDLEEMDLDRWFKPLSPIVFEGSVDRFGETITVRGDVRTTVQEVCGRCAREFEHPLSVEILVFSDRQGSDSPEEEADLERDGHLVYHDGVLLDVGPPIRESLALAAPISPLCSETCQGLCAGCGADLNTEACRCTEPRVDPRWQALKDQKK